MILACCAPVSGESDLTIMSKHLWSIVLRPNNSLIQWWNRAVPAAKFTKLLVQKFYQIFTGILNVLLHYSTNMLISLIIYV